MDTEENNILVIDSNGTNETKISTQALKETDINYGASLYLSSWSVDGQYLLYNVQINDEYPDTTSAGKKLAPSVLEGFYVADLVGGKVYFLAGLPNYIGFLPKTTDIVFKKESGKRMDQTRRLKRQLECFLGEQKKQ